MAKERALYCADCGKQTVHRRINRDSMGKDAGLFRPIFAIASLGLSEMTMYAEYTCEKCGAIRKARD